MYWTWARVLWAATSPSVVSVKRRWRRDNAREHIYFNRMYKAMNPVSTFAMFEACCAQGNPDEIAYFLGSFYSDPDPQIDRLRAITCPCLMLEDEYDVRFIKPAELVARVMPNSAHRVLGGMGQVLAFKEPQRLGNELLEFLGEL